ncbi:MAG: B12-binding domain-containing radical SAM protein [Candidatus Bathyarchaeota archaeon]|nr:B12-binding domain-containing radical SAM protein [Candidatus Bathyarchaeota archaeon]
MSDVNIIKASKKLKVALVIPPSFDIRKLWCPNLPIGLAYLASVIEKSGHELKVFDCLALGLSHEGLGKEFASYQPDVVGITSVTPTIKSAYLTAKVAKENAPDSTVVIGGPHASFLDREVLAEEPAIDIVVRGEGELTSVELLSKSLQGRDLSGILGISFRKNGEVIRTPDRPFIQNLDDLPYPAYQYFALRQYRFFGRTILPILTSRGCPYQCSYCVSSRMAGKGFRARDPIKVVDELEWLKSNHNAGAGAFSFYDDAFTYDINRAMQICDEMRKRKINVPWDCQTRVDRITPEVLQKMKAADCQLISFGAESGCQKILDSVNKRTTVELNEKAVKMAKKAGLSVAMSVIIGYPGETEESLQQTYDFIRRAEPDYVYLCLATPYPGTHLSAYLKELGWKVSNDWSQYDLQIPVFENPLLGDVDLVKSRREFYDHFYSWRYIARQYWRGTFYSKNMGRTALNDRIWRTRSLRWAFTNLAKLRSRSKKAIE